MSYVRKPLPFLFYGAPPPLAPVFALATYRDRLRSEFRSGLDGDLEAEGKTGVPGVTMKYTERGYANAIVRRLGVKIVGWPADIPFANPSDILGGTRTFLILRSLRDDGTLRFEDATDEEIEAAERNPRLVHPNPPRRRAPPPSNSAEDAAAATTAVDDTVVCPAVLAPGTLAPLGVHPTSTRPSVATLGVRARRQRKDVKKARSRPVTNPLNLPLRRPKRGVRSARYVLEAAGRRGIPGEHYRLVEDPMEEFRSEAMDRLRRAARACNGGGKRAVARQAA
ncbi:hypothetical protein C8Q77DRAFT_1074032 [Trametes polyzona]|nr:hypothetical protein C8Q77DRAFT_1074030 [Trametes polyzona]KAI0633170.1 hypothetical protein C8Q77DRAFT_1074032 [Trametes polyzona]